MSHIPVLLKETLGMLSAKDGEKILDGTFGGGGHTIAILNFARCSVCAIDRDPEAALRAKKIETQFQGRFKFIESNFSKISEIFDESEKFDGVLFDFGISSFQIDDSNRGFSFMREARLDMRMSKNTGISAYDVVNTFSKQDLSDIIWTYGDEQKSRKIADAIIKNRASKKIETTTELRKIINEVVKISPNSKIDPATKTFQAIRIFVNDELTEIDNLLKNILKFLNNGARLAFISFHSLEDRIIKIWGKENQNLLQPLNKKTITPSHEEIISNPRSRSAILRGFVYTKKEDTKFLTKTEKER